MLNEKTNKLAHKTSTPSELNEKPDEAKDYLVTDLVKPTELTSRKPPIMPGSKMQGVSRKNSFQSCKQRVN